MAVHAGVIGIFGEILLSVTLHLKADDCLAM